MSHTLTEIAFVLDRSGSMASTLKPTIESFNHFLKDQQQTLTDATRFSLILFDGRYETPLVSVPIQNVPPLTTDTFIPRGSTALLDAIARTIDDLGTTLHAQPPASRPQTVIVAILTDGEENSSTHFTWNDVSSRIRHQTDKYGWQFFFLAAGEDAIATAGKLSIHSDSASAYTGDGAGVVGAMSAMSRRTTAIRKTALGQPLTNEEAKAHSAPLASIVAEEDTKAREQP